METYVHTHLLLREGECADMYVRRVVHEVVFMFFFFESYVRLVCRERGEADSGRHIIRIEQGTYIT